MRRALEWTYIILKGQLLGLLPGEFLVREMSVLGRPEVDGLGQIEFLDDHAGPHVEVLLDDSHQFVRAPVRSSIRLDEDGQRLRNTNGVRKLDQRPSGQFGRHERLGDPPGEIGRRAINLRKVLAGKGATAVRAPAAVRVDDDLTAGQTGVALGAANDKQSRWLDLVSSIEMSHISGMYMCIYTHILYSRGRWSARRGTALGWPS